MDYEQFRQERYEARVSAARAAVIAWANESYHPVFWDKTDELFLRIVEEETPEGFDFGGGGTDPEGVMSADIYYDGNGRVEEIRLARADCTHRTMRRKLRPLIAAAVSKLVAD